MPSPFDHFISDLSKSRLEAKKKGDDAMNSIYKILMNSLYGRFGIRKYCNGDLQSKAI